MLFFRSLSSLFCCCVVSVVIVRDCRSMQADLNANLQNSHSHKDLDRTVENAAAALDVVDTEQLLRLSVIRRMHSTNTDDAAEVEKTEGDQQITGKGRRGGLEEDEDDEEDDDEEEEWLPVFNGGKQKLNGDEEDHRDEKRVKRDEGGSDGKDSSLHKEDAIDGRLQHQHQQQHQQQQHQQHQQQYTTLHTRNDNDDEAADEVHGEAGSDAVDHTPEEDKEESDDRSTEVAAKDSDDAAEDGSEEETGKEGETVKERDGEVNAEAEASIDDEEEEEDEEDEDEDDEEEEEDEASSKEKIAETDGEQKRKETSEEDSSQRDDLPTEDDTNKQDDALDEDDTKKQDDALDEDDTQKKLVTSEVEEETEEMTDDPDKDDQTAKEDEEEDDEDEERKDSMDTRRLGSETMTQKEDEDDGDSDEHLTNSGVSKGKDKESTGSGDEKDEKVDFISDHLDRADDTSDESQAATGKDDESAEETDVVDATALATDDDDDDKEEGAEDEEDEGEAKEELASTTAKEKDADEDSEKLLSLPINEDKDDNGKDESEKFADEGSGDLEVEQNIEPRTGGEHEPDNPDNAGDEDGKDGEATKEQSIRRRGNWRYYGAHGPGNWSKEFSGCESSSSRFQSPISIVPEQTHLNDTLQAINLIPKHSEKKCNSVLFNDAKTVKVIFEHMSIRVKVDDRFYKVAWVQFHWGDTKDTGSEHVIAGRRFPLEMQVVCYDEENFPDVMETEWVADNASSSKIIILATLFEISDADNPLLSSIVGNLNSIQSPGQNVSIPTVNLKGLHQNGNYFYRYSGSLTSPPCQGGVEWIVFKGHQTISLSQLAKFRQLHEEDFEDGNYTTIDYNWRPIQPLEEGRVVTRNFPIPPPNNDNKKTLKPSAVHASSSFSHRSPAIDIFYVCTCMHFVWKLFLV